MGGGGDDSDILPWHSRMYRRITSADTLPASSHMVGLRPYLLFPALSLEPVKLLAQLARSIPFEQSDNNRRRPSRWRGNRSPMVRWCRFPNASRIYVREVSGVVVARTRATGRIRLAGVVLPKHGIKHRNILVRAPWSMPINRVTRQEAYPL